VVNCVGNTQQITGSPKIVNVIYVITSAPNSTVTVNGNVYDTELAGVEVVFRAGLVMFATTITNLTGDYSIAVPTSFNERAKVLVVIAFNCQ